MSLVLSYDLDEIATIAEQLLAYKERYPLYCFVGDLGLGKTTLIKAMLRLVGIDDQQMSSPSFPIINEYQLPHRHEKIYHLDLYRIEKAEDALMLDLDSYFATNFCLVEWPKFPRLFRPYPHLWIEIATHPQEESKRNLHIHFHLP